MCEVKRLVSSDTRYCLIPFMLSLDIEEGKFNVYVFLLIYFAIKKKNKVLKNTWSKLARTFLGNPTNFFDYLLLHFKKYP